MVQVNIYYSLRKNKENLPTLKLFADEDCARVDQTTFMYWSEPCYGKFVLDVKGWAYVDAVTTREEYLHELESLPIPPPNLLKILKELKR